MSAADGAEVPDEAIVKGYELPSGQYVLIDDDELAALDPEATRTIDIEEFVDLDRDRPDLLRQRLLRRARQGDEKPYALLARAMEETGKVGVARFVMRTKQYLAAVRPKDGKLAPLDDGLRRRGQRPGEIGEFEAVETVEVADKELTMAKQLIESLAGDFEPGSSRTPTATRCST